MDDYNNAAQNTYIGRRQPSNMTNTVTRTPQRRRPNTAYDGHDSGQQQHAFNANHDGYASFVNNPALGGGMETQPPNIFWSSNLCPPPGLLQPSAPQYCFPTNDVSVQPSICLSGQVSRQSFSQHLPQLLATPLLPPQVHNPTQWPLPVYHQPSEASDINEANDASGASRHAVGATAVPAARPSQQACRRGRVKTSRPTASHDVADSNTEYAATDHENDKDSNDTPDIRKQKRYQKKYEDQGLKRDPETGKFPQVCNLREWKKKGMPNTKPEEVYQNFEEFLKYTTREFRVAFDELPNFTGKGDIDPLKPALKGIKLKLKDTPNHGSKEGFEYNEYGQLKRKTFSTEDIREIVEFKIEESQNSKVPPKKDFTMWIQSAPCQANNRLNRDFDQNCRWKGCRRGERTIRAGEFRVAFDELPNFTGIGLIDPLKPALVLHLWCFERVFSREETQKYLTDGFLKGDTRKFDKDQREDKNIVRLDKDGKKHSGTIVEEWRKATYNDQEAIAQKMVDARREADAKNANSGNRDCEFYQEPTYSAGHLASLTFALTAWHTDQNTKYRTMNGNGTKARTRNHRNKKKPKGIRATFDYSFGDIEYYEEAKERQQKYKNKAPLEQGARTKQEDTEHRDSSDDPETKLSQAQAAFDTAQEEFEAAQEEFEAAQEEFEAAQEEFEAAQEEFEAAKKRLEEAKRKLDDAQQNYDEAEEKMDAENHVEPERHVPKKKATKKEGKRNDPAAQTAVQETSESLETAKRDCRRAPKERSSAKDTDGVEKSPRSIQQWAKSHATAHTDDLGERSGNETAKENSEPSYIDANYGSHSSWPYLTDANGDFGGETLYTLPGTAGQGGLADNKNLNCPGSLGANQGEWPEKCDKTQESPSIVLEREYAPFWQGPMLAATSNASMPSTPMPAAWTPQSRVQEEAPDSDEDGPLRVKQEPSQQRGLQELPDSDEDRPLRVKQETSQQRGLQELPDYNNNKSDPMTVASRVAAPRKRGQRQISDYNDAEEPPSTKRARIAAPQQVSDAAAACHTPSYGPNRPTRNKRRADGDLDDSSHKRMRQ
ncbi:hypothetical protein MAJ_06647, partial [Metarhizium majus ARSEF 297]